LDTITKLPKPNEVAFISGTFSANKQAIISGLTIGETYGIFNSIDTKPVWLDDVVTITDAYLIFKEALSAGGSPNGSSSSFPYAIQSLLGEVTNDNKIDFDQLIWEFGDKNNPAWVHVSIPNLGKSGRKQVFSIGVNKVF
jgi:hypothetical protein